MIKFTGNLLTKMVIIPKATFGSGHHHEIDRNKIRLRDEKSGYYIDPNEATRRMIRVLSQH